MPTYETALRADDTVVTRKESIPGSGTHDVEVPGLPSDAVPARVAGRRLIPTLLDAKGQIDLTKYYDSGYFDPNFKFCVEFRGDESVDNRRRASQTAFTHWTVKPEHKAQLQAGEGVFYCTENVLGDLRFGHNYQFCSLQEFITAAWPTVPALGKAGWENFSLYIWNIEGSNYLNPGNVGQTIPGWPDAGGYNKDGNPEWSTVKDKLIQLENSNERITLEQHALRGKDNWLAEQDVRRSNRLFALIRIAQAKAAVGVAVSGGVAMYTALPNAGRKNDSDLWLNGSCKVQYCGGDVDGNITFTLPEALNGSTSWTIKMAGTPYDAEDVMDLYFYMQFPQISEAERSKIFDQKLPGTQSCEYAWSVDVDNYVALEKALVQHNWQRQGVRLLSHQRKAMIRQFEMILESDAYHLPYPEVQPVGQGEVPRLWIPPVKAYSIYGAFRFLMGATPNCKAYHFNENQASYLRDPFTDPDAAFRRFYNFPLHPYTALFQARRDMQWLERWYDGTYLIENPEVKFNQTGDWVNPSGIDCWDTYPYPKKNCYTMRFKSIQPPGEIAYYDVVILAGSGQGWNEESTDLVRYPGTGINDAVFRIKLRGPAPHILRFNVPASDSNQTYEAIYTAVPQFEKAGYAGLVVTPTN